MLMYFCATLVVFFGIHVFAPLRSLIYNVETTKRVWDQAPTCVHKPQQSPASYHQC